MLALVFVACVVVGVLVACIVGTAKKASDDDLLMGFAVGSFSFLSFSFLSFSFFGFRDVLIDVVAGIVAGIGVVAVGGLLLVVVSVVVEVGQRRGAQVPAHLRAVSPLAPRTLRWVRGLLPGDEGAAWLAEVTSCLDEARDKGERRRYVRSYRRKVPQLIWTSWALHLGGSRSRTLS
ncbi:MAG TPA: hypothetical protein VK887_06335 [Pseudonocardiaceae bacterium]|nr:hypothetical protein [Pseudonocardiaceae bacterium]